MTTNTSNKIHNHHFNVSECVFASLLRNGKYTYSNNLAIDELNNLLNYIHQEAIKCENYEEWDKNMEKYIEKWQEKVAG